LEESLAEQIVHHHYLKLGIGNLRKAFQSKVDTYNRLRLAGTAVPLNSLIHRKGQRVLLKRPHARNRKRPYGKCTMD